MRRRRQICAGLKPLSALVKGLNGVSQGALWLAVLLSPFVALAGGLGFQVTLFLLGLSAIIAWSVDRSGADYLRAAWPLFLLAFTGWAWISSLWSDYQSPNDYLLFGLLIPLLFVPLVFLRLSPLAKERLSLGVIGVGLLGVGLLVLESVSGFMLSFWADPVAVGGDALSFIGLAVSAQLNNLNVIVPTLVISVAASLVAWRNPKLGLMIAFFIAIVSILFAPLLAVLCGLIDVDFMRKIPLSWEHRVRMWSFSGELIKVATSGAVTIGVWQHWWWALIVFSASLIILIPPKMNAS